MLKQQTRLMVGTFVLLDIAATALAWLLSFYLRFEVPFVVHVLPVTKGVPELERYLLLLPFMAVLWPVVMYFHGLYQVKRGRSRIDEFFAIFMSVALATALTMGATLYVRVYYRYSPEVAPLWEYSQAVFAIFAALDVLLVSAARHGMRRWLERRWAAGHNVRRVVIVGASDLGQTVAETIAAHRELGYRLVGFVDDDHRKAVAGLPVLGSLSQAAAVVRAHQIDQVCIALPPEEHSRLLGLIKELSNECVDVKVVPDVVQFATLRAALDDLDGIPIISLNEVPLRGWNSMVKRVMDIAIGSAALLVATVVIPILPAIAVAVWWRGGKGPILLRQERMTLDGRTFEIFKFRTMVDEAERDTGPVFALPEDPRRTPVGAWLRRFNLDELPQLINVVRGDMSLVGPRPERPPFVAQFRERIPQYMLRHRVKAGMTGWAQVNGWRGNTSIEKRIEFDLYYVENWSLLLDLKIIVLTLFRGFGQKHAY